MQHGVLSDLSNIISRLCQLLALSDRSAGSLSDRADGRTGLLLNTLPFVVRSPCRSTRKLELPLFQAISTKLSMICGFSDHCALTVCRESLLFLIFPHSTAFLFRTAAAVHCSLVCGVCRWFQCENNVPRRDIRPVQGAGRFSSPVCWLFGAMILKVFSSKEKLMSEVE